jgi:hypothetical protein
VENNVQRTKVMRISSNRSSVHIKIQIQIRKFFKYLDSPMTHDTRCTHEINPDFSKERGAFTGKVDLNLRKKLVKFYTIGSEHLWHKTWTPRGAVVGSRAST